MIKYVAMLRKREGLSREEFLSYWQGVHAALARKLPGVRRYVISPAVSLPGTRGQPRFDGLAELWFDDLEAFRAAFATPQGRAAVADLANFAQTEALVSVVTEEIPILT